jgi:hypothetical protein
VRTTSRDDKTSVTHEPLGVTVEATAASYLFPNRRRTALYGTPRLPRQVHVLEQHKSATRPKDAAHFLQTRRGVVD